MTCDTAKIDSQKEEIDAYRPSKESVVKRLREYFKIGLTYSSNALEGNTLTESETKVVLEDGITIGGKPVKYHLEALGHSDSYDFMHSIVSRLTISEKDILELHRLFYFRIDAEKSGKYRTEPVIITASDAEFPRPHEIPQLMTQFVARVPALKSKVHPVVFAAHLHIDFVNIHPFIDGNGRTARLLLNLALLQAGYGLAIIPPILRSQYISAVALAKKGQVQSFLDFIVEIVWESQKDYLRVLKALS